MRKKWYVVALVSTMCLSAVACNNEGVTLSSTEEYVETKNENTNDVVEKDTAETAKGKYTGTVGGFEIKEGVLIKYFGSDTAVDIPEEVKEIGEKVFYERSDITSVSIPEGVRDIGDYAFFACANLTDIRISNGVTRIGNYAFANTNLASISIPDSVTSIGDDAFVNTNLASINIPDSITSIGSNPFYNTPWLDRKRNENPLLIINNILVDGQTAMGDVVIPDGVICIGAYAFLNSKLESVSIPDSVTSIGAGAFGYSDLASINIPESVTSIGAIPFYDTPWLESKINENPLLIINNILVDGRTVSGEAAIPEGVTSIGDCAFYECKNIKNISIPDSVKSIGKEAFYDCSNLTSINIGDNVVSIAEDAFSVCPFLTISCPSGSYAEQYAKDKNITYVTK